MQAASTHKSRPTMFSSTELFPLDCDPTTAIWGKSMGFWTWDRYQYTGGQRLLRMFGKGQRRTPTVVKTSWSLFTSVMSPGSLTLMLHTCELPAYEGPSQTCAYAFGFVAIFGALWGVVVQVQAVFAWVRRVYGCMCYRGRGRRMCLRSVLLAVA